MDTKIEESEKSEIDYKDVPLTADFLKRNGFKEANEYKGKVYKISLPNEESVVVSLSETRTDSLRVDYLTKGKDTYTSMTVSNLSLAHLLKAFDLVGVTFVFPSWLI